MYMKSSLKSMEVFMDIANFYYFCHWTQWGETQVIFMEDMRMAGALTCLWLLIILHGFLNWKLNVAMYSTFLIKSSSMSERWGWMPWGFSCFILPPPSSFILHTSYYNIIGPVTILAVHIADSRLPCTSVELRRSQGRWGSTNVFPSVREKEGLEMPLESGLHGHSDHLNMPHSKRMTCSGMSLTFENGEVPLKEPDTSDVNSG